MEYSDGNEVVVVTNVYGDICIRKKARRKRQKLLVKELMYDYANNTTLHGLPYVTKRGLTLIEKIFWFVTFVASVSMCLFLISKVWYKWKTSPVIVTVSEQLVSVNEVYIQHPTDLPQSSLYYYAVTKDQVSSLALSFSVLNTSESLRDYDAEVRQCYFPEDRYLKYFKIYTASNCRIECLSNVTKQYCDCIAFYMPDDQSNRICTMLDNDCVKEAKRIMEYQELSKENSSRCHCLPACNTMDYDAEILRTNFNLKRLMDTYNAVNNFSYDFYKGVNFSKLEMYFKQPRFMSWRRSELFGLIDFLANCGGLLGLFLGFSFLSLVEVFYFLSLRLCCTLKKDLEEEKAQKVSESYIKKY
ncbi:hypothetical protein PYW07_001893 [Mythimna separata]|uniref:Uncharacterized protein n=1 Tax=Mythimna separata TaxID=271217 RepID=A0AAD8DXD8_MYTSE|nr:hypothetical protein PYW07_001893 [Mythimna separata]